MKIYSIIRDGEYKKLNKLEIEGSILDLGGNSNSEYHKLIKGEHIVTTVNINPEYGCDMVFDIQKNFPIESEKFDAVLSMNVLEHIYKFDNVISETSRILKKGGKFVFTVPYMHHIHGSPDDYFRYTRSAIERMLKDHNFTNIEIDEIGLGVFSLFYQSIAGVFPTFLKLIFKNIAVFIDKLFYKISKRYRNVAKRIPLGYFVVTKK
ncbi:MAG: methyltransferase domain-containing protein [Candidatus Pacebacteria bacterium]|nr:methyltransferase domain-containing protein [Candidatus Paceibacterota bacterium]